MKKILAVIGALALLFAVWNISRIYYTQHKIIENASNFIEEILPSQDGKYVLHTQAAKTAGIDAITFRVVSTTDELLFQCDEAYRAYDFKGIEWDGHDILLHSGDVGTVRYIFNSEKWEKE